MTLDNIEQHLLWTTSDDIGQHWTISDDIGKHLMTLETTQIRLAWPLRNYMTHKSKKAGFLNV
jgi:hypothetical protein